MILVALLVPYAVAVIDLYARCRRQRISLLAGGRALRSRLLFWLFAGLVFTCFRLLGAWPAGSARPPNPATAVADDWPVPALVTLSDPAGRVGAHTGAPRRAAAGDAEEELAGYTVALLELLAVALLITATNPFALIFALPALNIWLWLPQIRIARAPVRLTLFALGLIGPALLVFSLAWRYGLGLDAPWYLLELVGVGYVRPSRLRSRSPAPRRRPARRVASGRYAPYPPQRPRDRGPVP